MYKVIIIFLALFSFTQTYSQESELEFGLLNMASGAVVGGIGAVINKKPNQKFHKVLGKGFLQGALGGYLVFESKRLLRTFVKKENYAYVWPSKIVNSAGISIIENAAANRNFWNRWHLNIGFTRLDIYTKDKLRLKYRIMPFSLLYAVNIQIVEGNIDFNKSLKLGVLVFTPRQSGLSSFKSDGAQISNHIALRDNPGLEIEAHEVLHVYQQNQFSGFNSYFIKTDNYLKRNYKWYSFYKKVFHTDFNTPIFSGIYRLGEISAGSYRVNIFEKEAYFFTR